MNAKTIGWTGAAFLAGLTFLASTVAANPLPADSRDDTEGCETSGAVACTFCITNGTNCVCVSAGFGCRDVGYGYGCVAAYGPGGTGTMSGIICDPLSP